MTSLGGRQGVVGIGFALSALAAVLALALAGSDGGSRARAGGGSLGLDLIGEFAQPVHVDDAPKTRKLLFVVEQPGTIQVLRNGRRLRKPFLNLSDRVGFTTGEEEGLLSIAFHPKYRKNRRFYVYYTNNGGNIEVDQFRRREKKSSRASAKSRRQVIEVPHPGRSNHNGGQLQFGPDKLLYLAPGDSGGVGDPDDTAQNRRSLLGKLLRIKPKGLGGYRVPQSNPFVGEPGRDEIYSLGLRNPYRFSFDSKTGHISIGDVGQDEWEEIDHETLASTRGANFGWDCREGAHPFSGPGGPSPACAGITGLTEPIHEFENGDGSAVIGGYVVRDATLGGLEGRYVYSDLAVGDIRSLNPHAADPASTDTGTGLDVNSPSSFGEGRKGRIYVTSLAGPVYRIVSR